MNIHSGSDMEVYTATDKQKKYSEEQTNTVMETDEVNYNMNTEQYYSIDESSAEVYNTLSSEGNNITENNQDNSTFDSEQYQNYYTDDGSWNNWKNTNYTSVPVIKQTTFADIKRMVYELLEGLSVLKKLGKTDEEIQKMVEDETKHYQADIVYQTQEEIDEAETYNFIDCISDDIKKFKAIIQNPIVAAIVRFPVTSKQISILYDSLMQMIAKNDEPEKEIQHDKIEEREQLEQLIEKVTSLENIVEHLQDEMQNILIAIKNEISPESIIHDLESFKDALKMDLIDNLNREIEYLKEKVTEIDTIYSQHEDEQETIVNFINEKLSEFEEKLRESRGDIPDIVWQKLQEQLEHMREELEYTLETKLENKIESKIQHSRPASDTQYSKKEETQEYEESEQEPEEEEETEENTVEETQERAQTVQVETKTGLMDMLKDPKKLSYVIGGGAVIGFIIAKIFHIHI